MILGVTFYLEIYFSTEAVYFMVPIEVAVFYDVCLVFTLMMIMISRGSSVNTLF